MEPTMLFSMLPMLMSNREGSMWTVFSMLMIHLFISQYMNIFKMIKSFHIYLPFKKTTKYTIKAHITFKNNYIYRAEYPINFLAICRKLKLHILQNKYTTYEIQEFPNFYNKEAVIFIDLKSKYAITDNIFITTEIIKEQSDKNEFEYVVLEIILETTGMNYQIIENMINNCVKEYNDERLDTLKIQHVFIFNEIDTDSKELTYQEYPFETTKSFNNMFFDDKEAVLSRIQYFINNKKEYMELGIPHTLGLLLYGQSGSGKTSYIKALAKLTGRHVIILPTNKIKNIDTLKAIFLNEHINGINIPNNKRIYIFEDIDCGEWEHVVRSRTFKHKELEVDEKTENKDLVEMICKLTAPAEDDKKKKPIGSDKNTITLGDFLELLDGVIEIPGRMLIMTSNHPEILDSALIRPGRIDMVIEFKKLSKQNVQDMYKIWFKTDIPIDVYEQMNDHMFTQAEIGHLFACRNIKEINDKLIV